MMPVELIQLGERIGWVFIHSLWQGAVLAGGVACLLPWLNASARHAVLTFGCAAIYTSFIVDVTPQSLLRGIKTTEFESEWLSRGEVFDSGAGKKGHTDWIPQID